MAWRGCSLHDLIQPAFTFLVGAAHAVLMASRPEPRADAGRMLPFMPSWRSVLLVLLGVFLRSMGRPQTYWTFEDTLSQIGLGYFPLFLLGLTRDHGGSGWRWC